MNRVRIIIYTVISILIISASLFSYKTLYPTEELKDTQDVHTEVETASSTETNSISTNTPDTTATNNNKQSSSTLQKTPEPIRDNTKTVDSPIIITKTTTSFDSVSMLTAHNLIRKSVGVSPLTYSKTLAANAQKWSDELKKENCVMKHDQNTPYGENLYWVELSGDTTTNLIETPENIVAAWAEEENYYNYSENSCDRGKQCGHYTQIIWEDTTEVGCGVSVCSGKNYQREIWVCRYNPPGNYIGIKPY